MYFHSGGNGDRDPFEQFFYGHYGRRQQQHRTSDDNEEDSNKYYERLGVSRTATSIEIRKAYRKLAVQHHPDKGGDECVFQEINAAYEVLSDPEKRAQYDRQTSHNHIHHRSPYNSASSAQHASSPAQPPPRRRKGENIRLPLSVTLEDLYTGNSLHVPVERNVIVGEPLFCQNCNGQGIYYEIHQLMLGIATRIRRKCQTCDGEGYICQRETETNVISVTIRPGMKHGQKMVVAGMGEPVAGPTAYSECGDLIVILQQQPHTVFTRKNADLLLKKTITLKEALTGYRWKCNHLDGRELILESKPGEIIKPYSVAPDGTKKPYTKFVHGEGMPSYGNPFVKGDLYVVFTVEFPDDGALSMQVMETLATLLPGPSREDVKYDPRKSDICHLWGVDGDELGRFGSGGAAAAADQAATNESDEDDDDDDDRDPRGCQQS